MGWKFPLTYIPNGSVTASKLADLSVTTAKIADNAATQAKIALAAIGTDQLADLAVATGKIALLAVTTTQLANGAVATGNIADLAVVVQKLADAAVATAKIADGAVVSTKIANANITNALIANLAVGTANIQIAAITNALIADLSVTNAKITDLAADKITAGTITATIELLAATVTGGLIRTAASGQRVEITGSHVDRVAMFSGSAFETAAGRFEVDPSGMLTLVTPTLTGLGTPMVRLVPTTDTVQIWSGDGTTTLFVDDGGVSLDGGFIKADVWHSMTSAYQNGWVDYGSAFRLGRYRKDASGTVHLEGLVKSGTMGTTIFTLPAGYRPIAELPFPSITQIGGADGIGRVDVDTSGNVIAASGTNNYLSLNGVTFATD